MNPATTTPETDQDRDRIDAAAVAHDAPFGDDAPATEGGAPAGAGEPSSEPAPAPALEPEAGGLLENLRRRRESLAADATTLLDVPGYGGLLTVRYRTLDAKAIKQIGKRAESAGRLSGDEATAELNGGVDQIAASCVEVLVRDQETGALSPIDPSGEPRRFDRRLAELLGFEAENGRQVVYGVFGPDMHIMGTVKELTEWQTGASREVDEALAGESRPRKA